MRRSTFLPLFALLLGGCPFEENSLSTTPAVAPGDSQPDERGVRVLARTLDPRWPQFDAMALSDNYLFFAMNWHGVYKMPKFGGPIEALDTDEGAMFLPLATNGSEVVWQKITFDSNDDGFGQTKRQPVDGGPTQVVASGLHPVMWKANRAFLVNVAIVDTGIELTTQPLAGGGAPTTRIVHDYSSGPGSFDWVIDETFVYVWHATAQDAAVARYPIAVGDAVLLAHLDSGALLYTGEPSLPVDGTVALDDEYLYVRMSKDIRRIPKAGGEASVVYAAAANEIIDSTAPIGTLDARSVYFDMVRDGSLIIASVPKTGAGPAVDLRFDSFHWNFPWQILQGDDYLFVRSVDFSNRGLDGIPVPESPGVILLVPKTPPAAP